jgi:hypothetical protein
VAAFLTRITGTTAGRPLNAPGARPASGWAFAGVAVISFGGPLALAALYAPGIVGGTGGTSAGFAMVAAVVVFAFPPLFLGGEIHRPFRTIRWGLIGVFLVTAAVTTAAVIPLAADPAVTQAAIPGMTLAERFGGHGFAIVVGVGVAVSSGGVILAEYIALSRLVSAVTSWPPRPIIIAIGAVVIAAAPLTLINPERIYNDLLMPSLVALWLSQIIVFAVYPRFAARQHKRALLAWVLAAASVAFAIYGLWSTIQHSSS